jgi:hypothetical protein
MCCDVCANDGGNAIDETLGTSSQLGIANKL